MPGPKPLKSGYRYGDLIMVGEQEAYFLRPSKDIPGHYWVAYKSGGTECLHYRRIRPLAKRDGG